MPAHIFLRSRMVGSAMLLTLAAGCGIQNAQITPFLGASSGGGAAFSPAVPAAAPRPPAATPTELAAPREDAAPPTRAAVTSEARPSRTITITASGGDVIELAAPPAHGIVAISGSGGAAPSLRYTPALGYLGHDQFSISLAGGRRTVTVSVVTTSP